MRRRLPPDDAVKPPAKLVRFDPNEWGMVDLADSHRLWSRERHAWRDRYGWPGGLTMLDLLRQDVTERRRAVRS